MNQIYNFLFSRLCPQGVALSSKYSLEAGNEFFSLFTRKITNITQVLFSALVILYRFYIKTLYTVNPGTLIAWHCADAYLKKIINRLKIKSARVIILRPVRAEGKTD